MNNEEIGFVFTNYNNTDFTLKLLLSIDKISELNVKNVVIVDNNSNLIEKNKLLKLKSKFQFVELILNKKNLGYFAGLNCGIEKLRKKQINCIIVGNNDLVFPNNFLKKLLNNSRLFNKYPVISPSIISIDGVFQNPHVINEISSFRKFIWDIYYSSYFMAKVVLFFSNIMNKVSKRQDVLQHDVEREILQGYGACFILTPIFFKYFKKLWTPTFLMEEEFFLRTQIFTKNFKTLYCPDISVTHHDHAAINKIPKKTFWKISKDAHIIYKKVRQNKIKYPENLDT
tara:strand:+ start:1446 stop:2300 length:855 start_codon:yes stop_codon:yes gene_type:complete